MYNINSNNGGKSKGSGSNAAGQGNSNAMMNSFGFSPMFPNNMFAASTAGLSANVAAVSTNMNLAGNSGGSNLNLINPGNLNLLGLMGARNSGGDSSHLAGGQVNGSASNTPFFNTAAVSNNGGAGGIQGGVGNNRLLNYMQQQQQQQQRLFEMQQMLVNQQNAAALGSGQTGSRGTPRQATQVSSSYNPQVSTLSKAQLNQLQAQNFMKQQNLQANQKMLQNLTPEMKAVLLKQLQLQKQAQIQNQRAQLIQQQMLKNASAAHPQQLMPNSFGNNPSSLAPRLQKEGAQQKLNTQKKGVVTAPQSVDQVKRLQRNSIAKVKPATVKEEQPQAPVPKTFRILGKNDIENQAKMNPSIVYDLLDINQVIIKLLSIAQIYNLLQHPEIGPLTTRLHDNLAFLAASADSMKMPNRQVPNFPSIEPVVIPTPIVDYLRRAGISVDDVDMLEKRYAFAFRGSEGITEQLATASAPVQDQELPSIYGEGPDSFLPPPSPVASRPATSDPVIKKHGVKSLFGTKRPKRPRYDELDYIPSEPVVAKKRGRKPKLGRRGGRVGRPPNSANRAPMVSEEADAPVRQLPARQAAVLAQPKIEASAALAYNEGVDDDGTSDAEFAGELGNDAAEEDDEEDEYYESEAS